MKKSIIVSTPHTKQSKTQTNKSWVSSYSPTLEEFENLALGQWNGKLWSLVHVHVTSDQSYAIDFSL